MSEAGGTLLFHQTCCLDGLASPHVAAAGREAFPASSTHPSSEVSASSAGRFASVRRNPYVRSRRDGDDRLAGPRFADSILERAFPLQPEDLFPVPECRLTWEFLEPRNLFFHWYGRTSRQNHFSCASSISDVSHPCLRTTVSSYVFLRSPPKIFFFFPFEPLCLDLWT